MIDGSDEDVVLETVCHVKRCLACQPKLAGLFKMLVEYGMKFSAPERFYFITLTYRQGKKLQRDADYVRGTWRRLLSWIRSKYGKGVKWLRVIELTKQMQPHLHVILSFGLGRENIRARCERKAKYDGAWLAKVCDCLEHVFSKRWHLITSDGRCTYGGKECESCTYVVDARDALEGDAWYLAKYVAKGFIHSDAFVRLGFSRSWSRSRSWPGERLQLETTAAKDWRRVEFGFGRAGAFGVDRDTMRERVERGKESPLRRRVGTELARILQYEAEDKAAERKVLKMMEGLRASNP